MPNHQGRKILDFSCSGSRSHETIAARLLKADIRTSRDSGGSHGCGARLCLLDSSKGDVLVRIFKAILAISCLPYMLPTAMLQLPTSC